MKTVATTDGSDSQILDRLMASFPAGMLRMDLAGTIESMNGLAAEILRPITGGSMALPPLAENLFDLLAEAAPGLRDLVLGSGRTSGRVGEKQQIRIGTAAGGPVQVISLGVMKLDAAHLLATVEDVTDALARRERCDLQEAQLRAIQDGARDHAFYLLDPEGRIASWNRSGERLKGYREEEVLGREFHMFYPTEQRDGESLAEKLETARRTGWYEDEGWRRRGDGTCFWASSLMTALLDREGHLQGFTRITRDLSERRHLEDRLREAATTDFLTGACNRREFYRITVHEITRRRRHGQAVALVVLEADHMRAVNDRFGHAAGDTVLRALVRTCRKELREVDALARLGGEEFAVLLPDTDAAGAVMVAERIRLAVEQQEVVTDTGAIRITVTLGVAEMSRAIDELEKLLRAGSRALETARAGGRNRVTVSTATATGITLWPGPDRSR